MGQMLNSFRGALVILLALAPYACSATATCYHPDGSVASNYQPCNNTDGSAAAACCELSSSACSLTGYCYGNAGVMYRGGCTDSTWTSVNCPQRCKDVNTGSFSNINLCPGSANNIAFTCSGSGDFTVDMCQTNFTFNAGTPFTPSSTVSQSTQTVTATATALGSSTTCPTNSSDTAQQSCSEPVRAIGLAVGIPLALLSSFLALVVYWQHRKHTSIKPSALKIPYVANPAVSQPFPPSYPQPKPGWKPQQSGPAELQTEFLHELHEDGRPF